MKQQPIEPLSDFTIDRLVDFFGNEVKAGGVAMQELVNQGALSQKEFDFKMAHYLCIMRVLVEVQLERSKKQRIVLQ